MMTTSDGHTASLDGDFNFQRYGVSHISTYFVQCVRSTISNVRVSKQYAHTKHALVTNKEWVRA